MSAAGMSAAGMSAAGLHAPLTPFGRTMTSADRPLDDK
jgi:hypothetical protein